MSAWKSRLVVLTLIFLGHLSDLCRDGLHRTVLGVDARKFGGSSALSVLGKEFWNGG